MDSPGSQCLITINECHKIIPKADSVSISAFQNARSSSFAKIGAKKQCVQETCSMCINGPTKAVAHVSFLSTKYLKHSGTSNLILLKHLKTSTQIFTTHPCVTFSFSNTCESSY